MSPRWPPCDIPVTPVALGRVPKWPRWCPKCLQREQSSPQPALRGSTKGSPQRERMSPWCPQGRAKTHPTGSQCPQTPLHVPKPICVSSAVSGVSSNPSLCPQTFPVCPQKCLRCPRPHPTCLQTHLMCPQPHQTCLQPHLRFLKPIGMSPNPSSESLNPFPRPQMHPTCPQLCLICPQSHPTCL